MPSAASHGVARPLTASGNASTMPLTLSGADKAALRVANKNAKTSKPVNFVSIGLKKA